MIALVIWGERLREWGSLRVVQKQWRSKTESCGYIFSKSDNGGVGRSGILGTSQNFRSLEI